MTDWDNIHALDYGWTLRIRIVQDEVIQDISSYTTRQFIFKPPVGATVTKTATFDFDGTDGVLKYTVEDGLIDQAGDWRVQARISKTGAELTSESLTFRVKKRN